MYYTLLYTKIYIKKHTEKLKQKKCTTGGLIALRSSRQPGMENLERLGANVKYNNPYYK